MSSNRDWAEGPAKWIAVGVLGAASIAGMTWTIAQKYPSAPGRGAAPAPMPLAQPEARPTSAAPVAPTPPPTLLRSDAADGGPAPPPAPAGPLLERLAAEPGSIGVEGPVITSPPMDPTYVRLIDINRAPAAELELLPGIGPALAARIVEHRQAHGPFRRVEDLTSVRGIGPVTLERLRPRVRLD